MIRTWRNIGRSGTVGLLHPDTHFVGDRREVPARRGIQQAARPRRLCEFRQPIFPAASEPKQPLRHAHLWAAQEIGFAHLSWLLDAAELPKSLALAEAARLPDGWDQESGMPGVKYKGDWDARPHPARVI